MHWSPAKLKPWARQAWINEHTQPSDADQGTNETLDTSVEFHNSLKKITDIEQALKEHGVDTNSINNWWAKVKNGSVSLGTLGELLPGMNKEDAAALRDLEEEVDHANGLLKAHPQLLLTPGRAEGVHFPDLKLPASTDLPLPSTADSNVISDSAFGGGNFDVRIQKLNALQKAGDIRYGRLIDTQQDMWRRVADRHVKNRATLVGGGELDPDPQNLYRDHAYPGEIPTVGEGDAYKEFVRTHPPNTPFKTRRGNTLYTPPQLGPGVMP
jgi:hypothetical protein